MVGEQEVVVVVAAAGVLRVVVDGVVAGGLRLGF